MISICAECRRPAQIFSPRETHHVTTDMVVSQAPSRVSLLLLPALLNALACTAKLGADAPAAAGGSPPLASAGGPAVAALDCSQPTASRAPVRRLTRFEYNNTVRDLALGADAPADSLPAEELGNGFGNDADTLAVSPLLIDGYRNLAQ